MKESHPPSLITVARRALTGETKLERGSVLVTAISGGPDSMALLHIASVLGPELGITVHAHGVDHGLRPEAATELDVAEDFATRVAVPFTRARLKVEPGGNLQARARTARYEALRHVAREVGARAIATAHHADDRAETVLLRLLRGSGPQGLAALLPESVVASDKSSDEPLRLLRPFLRARRSVLHAHVERHCVPFSNDPSNANPRFLRVRVRRELLPLLESLSPQIVAHLNALADQLAGYRENQTSGYALPRATQVALSELVRSGTDRGRVWLPGGLVATVDRTPSTRQANRANGGGVRTEGDP